MKHLAIKVYGRVQGVFYRAEAQKYATQLGLTGFARNDSDGSVNLEVEGHFEALEKFLEWCRKGPRMSRVDKVEYLFHDDLQNFNNFSIQ